MEVKQVPKKPIENKQYASHARSFMKSKVKECGGAKPFFEKIYGRKPVGNEHITLNNQINRGNYSAEFVGLLIDKLKLGKISMNEFFKGK